MGSQGGSNPPRPTERMPVTRLGPREVFSAFLDGLAVSGSIFILLALLLGLFLRKGISPLSWVLFTMASLAVAGAVICRVAMLLDRLRRK